MSGPPAPAAGVDQVPVRAPDGTVGTVPKAQLREAIDAGAEVVSADELARAHAEAKYGGVGGAAAAFGTGTARGLTFGLSDAAATAIGGEGARETLAGLKDANPNASLGGELTGALAPVILSGGAAAPEEAAMLAARGAAAAREGLTIGGAVRGLGVLPRGVAALGGMAERGVAGLVGEGAEGLAGRIAQRALPMAAGGAVEGAFYGGGQAVSEAALGDHELTAERLISSAGHGALFAGAAGAALGTGATLVQVGAEKIAEKLAPAFKRALDADSMEAFAGENAYQALNPTLRQVQKTRGRGTERAAEVGRSVLDEVAPTMDKPFWRASLDEIAAATRKRAGDVGEQIGSLLGDLDAAGAAPPDLAKIISRADKEVVTPLLGKAGYKNVAQDVASYLADLGNVAPNGVTFDALAQQRRALDDLIYRESTPLNPSPRVEELRKVRRIMEEELEQSVAKASPEVLSKYQAVKRTYGNLTEAADIAEKSAAREMKNRAFSPSDYMSGLSALVAGGMSPASLAVGFLTGAVHKFFREHGRAMLAMGSDTIAKTGKLQRLSQGVEREMSGHVKSFFGKTPRELVADTTAPIAARETMHEQYDRTAKQVAKAASDPHGSTARLTQSLGDMHRYAPHTAAAVSTKATTVVQYLATKLPKGHINPDSLTPHLDKPRVSDAEKDRFLRTVRGTDGRNITHDLAMGRISRESVEAFRVASPHEYERLVGQIHDQLSSLKEPLPYQKELQLRILLGQPSNRGLLRELQKTFTGKTGNDNDGAPAPTPNPIKLNVDALKSDSEKVEGR